MKQFRIAILLLFFQQLLFSNVVVINGLTHVHKSSSGEIISGVIKLKNISNEEQRIVIYFNDMVQECGKETVLTTQFSHERSIAKWFSTNINERILSANEEYELMYTINVPEEASLSGTYWGVVMIEVEKPIKEDQLEHGVKLESKVRYGIQILANINEPTPSEIDFYNVAIVDDGISRTINVDVQNIGSFFVQPNIILEVFNEKGERNKREEVQFKKIYPHSCKSYSIDISDLLKGRYTATLVADYGQEIYAIDLEFETK